MITTTQVVQDLLYDDGFILEALQRNVLNMRGYAKEIQKIVEERTMKPVKLGTIVVALSRIAKKIQYTSAFNPKITVTTMHVTSALSEISYEKIQKNLNKLSTLTNTIAKDRDFFTVTEGLHEITIICSQDIQNTVLHHFSEKPKIIIQDLVAISVRFPLQYMDIPNTIYSLVGVLATKFINVIEIVSTNTELTFLVKRHEMEKTIQALNIYSGK